MASEARRIGPGGAVAVLVSGGAPAPAERSPIPARVVRRARLLLAGARAARRAARIEAVLASEGLVTRRLGLGPRNDGYRLELSPPGARRAPDQVVVGVREPARASVLERVVAAAAAGVGATLRAESVRVVAAGSVMADLTSDRGAGFVLRLEQGGAPADEPLELLLSCEPPPPVRSLLVTPMIREALHGHAWSLEERRPGRHPERMTPLLWESCMGFLCVLRDTRRPTRADRTPLVDLLPVLEPHLSAELTARLRVAALAADGALHDLPLGWGHGDFHPGNLLVEEELTTVLDWDAASPASLPLLDHLHLHATTDPGARHAPHGLRCTELLLPLARRGGDARIREQALNSGADPTPEVLSALVMAYWLTRVARDLSTFPDRGQRAGWLRRNVVEPAGTFAQAR